MFEEEDVTFDIVLGAVCAYMLVAAAFANLYAFFEIVTPGAFQEAGGPVTSVGAADLARGHIVELLYFSFATLTTLGFGDISPVHAFPRAVVCIEALIGQIYPAILIAYLVGLRAARGPIRRKAAHRAS